MSSKSRGLPAIPLGGQWQLTDQRLQQPSVRPSIALRVFQFGYSVP
jgi:hypothetical protein